MENNLQPAERFIWSGGRPIYDLLKGLISPDRSESDGDIDTEIRFKFSNSQVIMLLDEREKRHNHNSDLQIKIKTWQGDIAEIKNSRHANSQKIRDAILWNDPKEIDREKIQVEFSIEEISTWIETANSAISENNREIDKINRSISIEFSRIQDEVAVDLQKEVNKHSDEIIKLNQEFRQSLLSIAAEFGFELRGGINNLKIYDISPHMLAGPMQRRTS